MDERLGDRPRILHLATGDQATGIRLVDFLTECGADIQQCSDVYRGLARLGRPRPGEQLRARGNSVDAVLVGVDGLSAGEFEFFEFCASLENPPPVWVYGGTHAQAKIALSLRLGAEFEANVDSLRSAFVRLAAPHNAPARDDDAPTPACDRNATDETRDEADMDGEILHRRATPDPEAPSETEAEVNDPLPVPWTRGGDGPRRTPPQASESQPASEPDQEGVAADDVDGPLLTEQELEALVGKPPMAPGARRTDEDNEIFS